VNPLAEATAVFECRGQRLLGIVHHAAQSSDVGVLIVVGGPQYRVGSHRQFVVTARSLAAAGYPVLRFDYRGMGDSEGEPRSFESISEDIRAAIDYFVKTQQVSSVVLFGLCDAASANLMYCADDQRVRGMILVNPWVRTLEGEARSYVRHYYLQRLLSRGFWRNLLSGGFSPWRSASDLFLKLARSRRGASRPLEAGSSFIERMYEGFFTFRGDVLLLISGRDLTAKEFVDFCAEDRRWGRLMARATISVQDLPDADHTFSSREDLDRADRLCIEWLRARF
jgi:uncharacterized protein